MKIIPQTDLLYIEPKIDENLENLDLNFSINLDDPDYGKYFKYYLLFTYLPFLLEKELDETDIIYNRYHWFLIFLKIHKLKNGIDVGLEQQATQILEYAEDDIDWKIIQEIEEITRKFKIKQ